MNAEAPTGTAPPDEDLTLAREAGSGERRRINAAAPLHEKTAAAVDALAAANSEREPRVLVRGSELVRLSSEAGLESLNVDNLRFELSRAADFGKVASDQWKSEDPPVDVARTAIALDPSDYGLLPRVDRVVGVPVASSDGDLVVEPGFDADSRLYYRPFEGLNRLMVPPPNSIDTLDVQWAVELLLDDFLGDFDFMDESSRAHALGMMLLPFLGERIGAEPTPLHAILAPQPGSGKTYLAQACLLPGCGRVPMTAGTDSNEEWRKRITSALVSGHPAVVLDNLHGTLDTGALAEALTSGVWADRILGESRDVVMPVRNVWAATGNNLGFSPEIVRRTVPIFLDPGRVRPSDRPSGAFRHPDLLRWGDENRAELVRACLTLIRHWLDGEVAYVEGGYEYVRKPDAGPRLGGATLGSFGVWAGVVGGVLESAGIGGFLENRDKWTAEADDETREAAEFLRAMREHGPLEARQLEPLCRFEGELRDHLPVALAEAAPQRLKGALTTWLKKHRGVRVGDLELVLSDGEGHNPRRVWSVRDHS